MLPSGRRLSSNELVDTQAVCGRHGFFNDLRESFIQHLASLRGLSVFVVEMHAVCFGIFSSTILFLGLIVAYFSMRTYALARQYVILDQLQSCGV